MQILLKIWINLYKQMKKDRQTMMAALSENMLTVNVLLSVFFLPGLVAGCTSHLHITTPKEMETLNGSCLHIPCTFVAINGDADFNNETEISGLWYITNDKDETNKVFDSSKSDNVYPMNITGILKENDCTTLFSDLKTSYEDTYYFRIVNGQYKATATCEHVQIKVKDSAWEPNMTISGDQTNLKEHQSVTVTCSAFTPCPHSPPELTWNLQQDSLRQTEKNTDGTFTTKIQENITLSDTHDGYNIRCSARYPVIGGNKTAETEVTLSVSYAPRNTSASISPSGLVSAGSWVELSCSSRAKPPPRFTWFRNNNDGDTNVSVWPVYSFNATEEEYYCVATNYLGNQTSSVRLRIKGIVNGHLFWLPIALAIALLVLICLVLYVRCFKSKQPTPQQTQTPAGQEAAVQTPSAAAEDLQYGEVTFFKRKPEASSTSEEHGKEEETVYAQVRVSKSRKCSTHTTDDIYAQVKKK
ncbi:myelin-associated glycoprotein-like isoform X1 [Poecilia latipinna]|uniref:myelin-associated glycoprotein-like isoform X1 n=2 Tax=Poecilia latipinna TaxID=48699 RepID=UPI00072E2E23|nr:PREDICTED: myelin-associated glycoprotein-like isoform X1 [Poecilia latipinna]